MSIYESIVIFQLFLLIVYGQGEIPDVKSLKKCKEYLNTTVRTNIRPLSDRELDFIARIESGYNPPDTVVRGYNSRPKQLSFMAALEYGKTTEKQYFCGGSLISPEFVILDSRTSI